MRRTGRIAGWWFGWLLLGGMAQAAEPLPPLPLISEVTLEAPTTTEVTVHWVTDRPSFAQVEVGPDTTYGTLTAWDQAYGTTHQVLVSSLTPGTTYHARARAKDSECQVAVGDDLNFMTVPLPVPTLIFTASPDTGIPGTEVTLSWVGTNVTTCLASDGWEGSKPVSGSASLTVSATTLYTLTCTGDFGSTSAQATVTVTPCPVCPPAPVLMLLSQDADGALYAATINGMSGFFLVSTTPPATPAAAKAGVVEGLLNP